MESFHHKKEKGSENPLVCWEPIALRIQWHRRNSDLSEMVSQKAEVKTVSPNPAEYHRKKSSRAIPPRQSI
jgi:hypothetical protein